MLTVNAFGQPAQQPGGAAGQTVRQTHAFRPAARLPARRRQNPRASPERRRGPRVDGGV